MTGKPSLPLAGIRREDKNPWEKRTPLVPADISGMVRKGEVGFRVEPASARVFSDAEFDGAGADIDGDLSPCKVIFGVKEIPNEKLLAGKAYAYFAHVIKGQPYNMAMLARLLDLRCTLIDYEKIEDDQGRRLIFFGRYAGIAGMIDTLWALGRRLAREGIESGFSTLKRAFEYAHIDEAKTALAQVALRLGSEEIPAALRPLVFGVAGYGHVSQGAQEILDLLPVREVDPADLAGLARSGGGEGAGLYKVVFKERHMAAPLRDGTAFDLQDYYDHPEHYRPAFETYLPHLTVLVNCIYWDDRYPRLVTRPYLRRAFSSGGRPRLRVIGDISCDLEGAVECTVRYTTPLSPAYVYVPGEDRVVDGLEGDGVVVLAIENFPSELPADASVEFSRMLSPFVPALLRADYTVDFEALALPPELKRAVIVHRGQLTPDYRYLAEHLTAGVGRT